MTRPPAPASAPAPDFSARVRLRYAGRYPARPWIYWLDFLSSAALGWTDEGIQAFLPNRVYDLRDVGFNALAGAMAVAATVVLRWASMRVRGEAAPPG